MDGHPLFHNFIHKELSHKISFNYLGRMQRMENLLLDILTDGRPLHV